MSIKRADIVAALVTRIQTISTGAGYRTALGAHVYAWLPRVIDDVDLPAANVRDVDDSFARDNFPYDEHVLSVEVDIAAGGITAIREAIYDVYKAIGTDPTLGGLAHTTRLLGDRVEVEQGQDTVAGAVVSLEVPFRTSNYQES